MYHYDAAHTGPSSAGLPATPHASLAVTFLRDADHGGDPSQASAVAAMLLDFISGARTSLHIAIYDFRLSPALGSAIVAKLVELADNGVDVKIAYDHTKPGTSGQAAPLASLGADPAPPGTHEWLQQAFATSRVALRPLQPPTAVDPPVSGVPSRPIAGSKLMHDKYVIRDVYTADAAVWTGPTNFTDDAWTHQENNIVVIASPDLATYYETDFQELWTSGNTPLQAPTITAPWPWTAPPST